MKSINVLKNKVVKNGIWLYALQFFNTVIPLLTIPYITRILSTAQYGIFSIALNWIGYFQVVIEYGFGMSATRKIAANEKNRDSNELSKLLFTVLCSRIVLFIASMIILLPTTLLIIRDRMEILSIFVLAVCLFGYCFQQNWLFQGLQDMKYISIINMCARIISTVCIFIFIKTQRDLLLYCVFYAISPLIAGISGFLIAYNKYQLHFVKISISNIVQEIKDGWFIFTTQLSSKVFGAIGITFLGIFSTNADVGIFSAIQKIPNMILLVWGPIAQVLYPISSKKMSIDFKSGWEFVNKTKKIILPIFISICGFVMVFSKVIINIAFGEEYSVYYYEVIPLLGWVLLAINNNFWGIQILLASGHDKEYGQCFQIGVVCTILLNFILVYFFKSSGASLAPFLSELILAGLLLWEITKQKRSI